MPERLNVQSRQYHTARGYQIFTDLIKLVDVCIDVRPMLGYSHKSISRRITQRVVELSLTPFLKACGTNFTGIVGEIHRRQQLKLGGLLFKLSKKRILPTFSIFVRGYQAFLWHWLKAFQVLVSSEKRETRDVTILYGLAENQIQTDASAEAFYRFCRKGPIMPLATANQIFIQIRNPARQSQNRALIYAQSPLIDLFKLKCHLRSHISFLILHLKVFLLFNLSLFRAPLLILLGKDFAYHALVSVLNNNNFIKHILITNSYYLAQPLWMCDIPEKKFTLHMVWYSTNSIPVVYKWDPIETYIPDLQHLNVDENWVWNRYFENHLRAINPYCLTYHVVGTMMWRLPQKKRQQVSNNIRICVFDVTPIREKVGNEMGLIHNYYQTKHIQRFVRDIVRLRWEVNQKLSRQVEVVLKHKREYSEIHDPEYVSLIQSVCEANNMVRVVDPDSDIYELIDSSSIVIVIPYSSPAHIATSRGVESIYYDPTGELIPKFDKNNKLQNFSGSYEDLKEKTIAIVGTAQEVH